MASYELLCVCVCSSRLLFWGSPLSPCGPMTWTGLAFTASLTEIALPKNAFWEEEYYLAHCTVGEVIALPPGLKRVTDKISEVPVCACLCVCVPVCLLVRHCMKRCMCDGVCIGMCWDVGGGKMLHAEACLVSSCVPRAARRTLATWRWRIGPNATKNARPAKVRNNSASPSGQCPSTTS